MRAETLALFLGLFGVPGMLMVLGHRLRGRSHRHRRRFWGGVYGYFAGMALAISSMLFPPVWWPEESFVRPLLIHWAILAGGVLGVLTGPLWARKPGWRRMKKAREGHTPPA